MKAVLAAVIYLAIVWYVLEYQSVMTAVIMVAAVSLFGLAGMEERMNRLGRAIDTLRKRLYPEDDYEP